MNLQTHMQDLLDARRLVLFLHEGKYKNPAIPQEYQTLEAGGFLEDESIQEVIVYLHEKRNSLPEGMYFPTPIAREIQKKGSLDLSLFHTYYYDFIYVDEQHNWTLKQQKLGGKILQLFLENLHYEPSTGWYYIQYQVDQRLDRTYVISPLTPMMIYQMDSTFGANKIAVRLNNGKIDHLIEPTLFLDKQEKCFAKTQNFGLALCSNDLRFVLLEHLNEEGTTLDFKGQTWQLQDLHS